MPGRGGDYDAGGMVRGSTIGKKLFGGSGLPFGHGGGRLRALVSGGGRPVGPEVRGRLDRFSSISDLIGLRSMLSLRLLLVVF